MKRRIGCWAEVFLGIALLSGCAVQWCGVVLGRDARVVAGVLVAGLVGCLLAHIIMGILRPSALSHPIFPALRGVLAGAIFLCIQMTADAAGQQGTAFLFAMVILPLAFCLAGAIENTRAFWIMRNHWAPITLAVLNWLPIVIVPMWGVAVSVVFRKGGADLMDDLSVAAWIVLTALLPVIGVLEIIKGLTACRRAVRGKGSDAGETHVA